MSNSANALVMLHGLLGPIDFFGPRSRPAAIDVHAPDLPGYCSEPLHWNGDALTLNQQAGWVADYLRSRVGRPACLLRVTGAPGYLAAVKNVVDEGIPLHLVAGEKSCLGWDVPAWVQSAAAGSVVLPGLGHMMMLEAPERFCEAVGALVATGTPHARQ